jgi:hypothetical protein
MLRINPPHMRNVITPNGEKINSTKLFMAFVADE